MYSAILSRSTVFEFKPVEKEDVIGAVMRAYDYLSGELGTEIIVQPEAAEHIAYACGGDVRKSINAVELSVIASKRYDEKIEKLEEKEHTQKMIVFVVNVLVMIVTFFTKPLDDIIPDFRLNIMRAVPVLSTGFAAFYNTNTVEFCSIWLYFL